MTLVLTWGGGIAGGAGITLGLIELVTGRLVNPKRWNWTIGEVRIHGLVTTTAGFGIAILSLFNGFVLSGPTWTGPAWWRAMWLPFILALPITGLLLGQHHNRRWPFVQRRAEGSS